MHRIKPNELEANDTTNTQRSTSNLDLHLEIDNWVKLKINFYDKLDDFDFSIVNFPFTSCKFST